MTKTLSAIGFIVAGAVVGLLLSAANTENFFSGVYNNVTKEFSDGITVDGTTVIDGSGNIDAPITSSTGTFSGNVTISGGNLVNTTGANATSTFETGAIETYATSSATKICIRPSTGGATSTFAGTLYFTYGECPSL